MDAYDSIERTASSIIQHGPHSDRVYVMKVKPGMAADACGQALLLAERHGYGKVFAKVPDDESSAFRERGFVEEARVPGMYRGETAGVFLSLFRDRSRMTASPEDAERIRDVLRLADERADESPRRDDAAVPCRVLREEDAGDLAGLYAAVFASYPFPIFDTGYLRATMQADAVQYFGVYDGAALVAASSAEMDHEGRNTEMTDFATLPARRGGGYAQALLGAMERAVCGRGHDTAFTIARALSAGMNITFARRGYRFGGTLVNNTQISGRIESMNVWYRKICA